MPVLYTIHQYHSVAVVQWQAPSRGSGHARLYRGSLTLVSYLSISLHSYSTICYRLQSIQSSIQYSLQSTSLQYGMVWYIWYVQYYTNILYTYRNCKIMEAPSLTGHQASYYESYYICYRYSIYQYSTVRYISMLYSIQLIYIIYYHYYIRFHHDSASINIPTYYNIHQSYYIISILPYTIDHGYTILYYNSMYNTHTGTNTTHYILTALYYSILCYA